jgi:NADH-quinone oxidoreductase subunit M
LIGAFTAGGSGAYPGVLGPWFAAFAALGMVIAAMYLLMMVGKMVFGSLREPSDHHAHESLGDDLSLREIVILVPLAILCVVLGVAPWLATDAIAGSIADTLSNYPDAVAAARDMMAAAR